MCCLAHTIAILNHVATFAGFQDTIDCCRRPTRRTTRRGGGGGGSGGGSGSIGKDRNRKLLKTLRAKAKKFVHQYKCAGYVETSALDGDGVEDAFSTLTKKVLGQLSGGSKMTVDRLIEEGDESRSNNMDGSKGVCCFGCCT